MSVESVYGRTIGVVTEYIRPDYSDPDTPNGLIRLAGGEIYEIEYLSFTTVIVADAANRYARTFTDEELGGLLVGKTVSVEYCPELYGEYMRALKITVQ